jgi:hypothetical protein
MLQKQIDHKIIKLDSQVISESCYLTRTLTNKQKLSLWLKTCCNKLKELNVEHVKILNEQKKSVQFPDLYAELYNL